MTALNLILILFAIVILGVIIYVSPMIIYIVVKAATLAFYRGRHEADNHSKLETKHDESETQEDEGAA